MYKTLGSGAVAVKHGLLGLWLAVHAIAIFSPALAQGTCERGHDPFTIAHNAGDNVADIQTALSAGADVIEIDLSRYDGQLRAAHLAPRAVGPITLVFGIPAQTAFAAVREADAVLLDLKQSDGAFLGNVASAITAL